MPTRRGQSKRGTPSYSLSDGAHQQIMEYLRLADKSSNPDIRAAAVDIAKRMSKYHRSQGARVSPLLILIVNIGLAAAVAAWSWYAFLHYPGRIAYELTGIFILLFFVIVGISLLLSGHMSQANFMRILHWMVSHIRTWWNREDTATDDEVK
jgi:hypothetical protein